MSMLSAYPDDDPEQPHPDIAAAQRLIDAIALASNPDEWRGGAWISGPCPTPTEQVSETSEVVAAAVAALQAFGADLSRLAAAAILPMWARYRELTPQQVAAVVAHFPPAATP